MYGPAASAIAGILGSVVSTWNEIIAVGVSTMFPSYDKDVPLYTCSIENKDISDKNSLSKI